LAVAEEQKDLLFGGNKGLKVLGLLDGFPLKLVLQVILQAHLFLLRTVMDPWIKPQTLPHHHTAILTHKRNLFRAQDQLKKKRNNLLLVSIYHQII
jgi:hypothetical protein